MAPVGSGRAQNPLEFDAGQDIGIDAIAEFWPALSVEHLEARARGSTEPTAQLLLALLIAVVDGAGETHPLAEAAADAGLPVDQKDLGDRLGIAEINGRSSAHPFVVGVDGRRGAMFRALAAAGAFFRTDIAGFAEDRRFERSRRTGDFLYLGMGDDPDVPMASGARPVWAT